MATQRVDIINELYIPLLGAVHIYPDEKGELYLKAGETSKPCELERKRILLPTTENLQRANDAEHVFFHPLSENIARGDSAIYNYLKLAISLRVNYTITGLADVLVHVAGDKQLEGKLKSSQLDLVKALPKVNDKMITNLVTSFVNMDLDKNMFYTVYNRRNGKIGNNTYNRVAVTRFPLLEQLNDPDKSPYWSAVKGMRKADIQAFQSLFQYLIPNWNVDNQYSGFSDSMEAPSFHALTTGFVTIMTRLNELCNLFADVADVRNLACSDLHVLDQALGNLQRYANVINPLPGNTGDIAENNQQIDKLQTHPIGIPPANLLAAAENKANAIKGNEPVQQQTAVQQTAPMQQQPMPQQGFIGTGQQMYGQYGYAPNPYMVQQQQPVNPYMAGQLGFQPYNQAALAQQQMLAQQQQAAQQQRLAADPIASWNVATQTPQYQINPYGQPVNQLGQPINAYGQPVMMQQPMPPQGFIGTGQQMYGRPTFPTVGQQQQVAPQQMMQQQQPTGWSFPKFNKI